MPIYRFKLHDGCGGIEDADGVSLRDDLQAVRYARDVVQELMKHRELETRYWRLDVYEADAGRICELPFAKIDPTLDHLTPQRRAMVTEMAERTRSLRDALQATYETVEETRALVARSRGKPYLAARFGRSVIRGG